MKDPNLSIITYLNACISRHVFPGCALAYSIAGQKHIITAGKLTYDPSSVPVTGETIYDVASITKAVPTSCLALALCEDGVWSPASRLIDFVPEFTGSFREDITIRHLLTHTIDFGLQLSAKKNLPPDALLETILTASLRTPPGTHRS
jgi:CubicO group peptidase (beta-lactamase class C family)